MKLKSIITFSILISLSFSILHGFAFVTLDDNQCNVSEFVNELDAPTGVDDICDTHFKYHEASIFTTQIFLQNINKISELKLYNENYNAKINLNFIIPPIS